MGTPRLRSRAAWALAAHQDDVVTWEQLLELGFTRTAVRHRVATGRLHRLWPRVYAVGRARVTRRGQWRAAVLACGPEAALSHESAGALWGMRTETGGEVHVSIPERRRRDLRGIRVHRRSNLRPWEIVERHGIRVTCPVATLIDLAARLPPGDLDRAVNAADRADLVDPETLRRALGEAPPRPGLAALRDVLDRHAFVLTDSELERRFVPLALRAGLGMPRTGARVNGFLVDFYWPELGLVVETDGLRYHRTPAAQARDRLRDQAHVAAGLTALRFTHGQVRYGPGRVEATLRTVATRLRRAR